MVTLPKDKMLEIARLVEDAGRHRANSHPDFSETDFFCGAMAVYFALGWNIHIPAHWVFLPLMNQPILNPERPRPDGTIATQPTPYANQPGAERAEGEKEECDALHLTCRHCGQTIPSERQAIVTLDGKPDDECPDCFGVRLDVEALQDHGVTLKTTLAATASVAKEVYAGLGLGGYRNLQPKPPTAKPPTGHPAHSS